MGGLFKSALRRGAVGFAFGVLVSAGIQCLAYPGVFSDDAGKLVVNLLAGGLLGAVNTGTTTLYLLENWGLLRCTLTHFVIAMASICAVGFTLGWLSLNDQFTLWMLAGCVALYFVIWLVQYRSMRRRVRQINRDLRMLKRLRAPQAPSDPAEP